jgi:cytochrome P450
MSVPVYRPDLFSRDAILDPYPHYERLRALGPVVRLAKQRLLAVTRHEDCRRVLLDDAAFVSGRGVALNPVANRLGRGTILYSDGEQHEEQRRILAHRLTPKALRSMREDVEQRADAVVEAAVRRGDVDGVDDVAQALPTSIVPDLIGLPQEGREHLLRWAGATFDGMGPMNGRAVRSTGSSLDVMRYARRIVRRGELVPGSMGDDLAKKVERGEMAASQCPALMLGYLTPSLDTTISAIASALLLLGLHPDQWDALKADPALVPNTVNEVVRLHTPVRVFSRLAAADTEIDGVPVRKGTRVVVFYASANRDERTWDDPDRFDVTRDATQQLGFGQGAHGCAGQGLARLETQSILRSLLARVDRIEVTGEPVWGVNNTIHKLDRLPLRLVAA